MATATRKAAAKDFEGEVKVCCHRVSFWWDITEAKVDEISEAAGPYESSLREVLEGEAEERAKACIIDGCVSGQLACVFWDGQTEHEIFGWWDIIR